MSKIKKQSTPLVKKHEIELSDLGEMICLCADLDGNILPSQLFIALKMAFEGAAIKFRIAHHLTHRVMDHLQNLRSTGGITGLYDHSKISETKEQHTPFHLGVIEEVVSYLSEVEGIVVLNPTPEDDFSTDLVWNKLSKLSWYKSDYKDSLPFNYAVAYAFLEYPYYAFGILKSLEQESNPYWPVGMRTFTRSCVDARKDELAQEGGQS